VSEPRRVDAELQNEAFREAGITDIAMSNAGPGQLYLKRGRSRGETIDALIGGLERLYRGLCLARGGNLAGRRQSSPTGPGWSDEALREARIADITLTETPEGQLYMHSDLSDDATIEALINGVGFLYVELLIARAREGDDDTTLREWTDRVEHNQPRDSASADPSEYLYWLQDGVTPYRSDLDIVNYEVFSRDDDAWMRTQVVWVKLSLSSSEEVASMIGGSNRLTDPPRGWAPAPSPKWTREGDEASGPELGSDDV
jgi:hypothetical protein